MSCIAATDGPAGVCANCGKSCDSEGGPIKLKDCTACRLVKYCGVDCQKAHRKQHKKACKQRAEELKDERLYGLGHERPEGDFCPICTLPIPLPMEKHSIFKVCCMKMICDGCDYAARIRGMTCCQFCRTPKPTPNSRIAMIQARVKKKDPAAIHYLGQHYYYGESGLQKDSRKAFELCTEAAELGYLEAIFDLGVAYERGEGVGRDKAKAVEFYKKAAMQGNVMSRHNLGYHEAEKGNHDRAVRHFLISARMGYDHSVESVQKMFMGGHATREQYAQAMRGYRDAVEEMKSHDRDEAKRIIESKLV